MRHSSRSRPLKLSTKPLPDAERDLSNSRPTRSPDSELSPTGARHSRLKSSRTHRMRKRLPSIRVNETLSTSLTHARSALSRWCNDYNDHRPHSGLGWLTPAEFAQTINPRRDAVLRSRMAPHRNTPLPPPIQQSKTAGANLKRDKTWGQGQEDCRRPALLVGSWSSHAGFRNQLRL